MLHKYCIIQYILYYVNRIYIYSYLFIYTYTQLYTKKWVVSYETCPVGIIVEHQNIILCARLLDSDIH